MSCVSHALAAHYICFTTLFATLQWRSQGPAALGLWPGSPAASALGPSIQQGPVLHCCLPTDAGRGRGGELMDTDNAGAAPRPRRRHHSTGSRSDALISPRLHKQISPNSRSRTYVPRLHSISILQTKQIVPARSSQLTDEEPTTSDPKSPTPQVPSASYHHDQCYHAATPGF